jgi:hypothetical protein
MSLSFRAEARRADVEESPSCVVERPLGWDDGDSSICPPEAGTRLGMTGAASP